MTLVCPRDHTSLTRSGNTLTCNEGHAYPIHGGIPVLVSTEKVQTHISAIRALDPAERAFALGLDDGQTPPPTEMHSLVRDIQGATSGYMFHAARNRFASYPIPEFRLPDGAGKRLLDVGCGWGRWSVAAALKGYRVTAVDHNFERLVIARRVCRQFGVVVDFVCADVKRLPFERHRFDVTFSYSVLQHFSKTDARLILREVARVLTAEGSAIIQMANRYGIRSLYHQLRKAWLPEKPFDVRYWTSRELLGAFNDEIGPSRISIDGFFGLGMQAKNAESFLPHHRAIANLSERLRQLSWLAPVADSLYVHSVIRPH